ncbi:bromodomain-containing protein [Cryptosporidium muris RN66]|uniref:Bromodomain-containing protein n=1 Tax=Cryptosporidium muris (strain RN66) TaxID=441375 RepID=B6ACC3_CRYMR|nr:bromodomain-containing protein [Cryptosporidium muris RN66]EEA06179.1 bromodomain-containing protein [Cryptosporidium muris RN66]|eukprot:XP_002140528.1 bromodomain-containing protein [Cryptosporidium muris RN66]
MGSQVNNHKLDIEINGKNCYRGELSLNLDELRWILLQIGPEFGFTISPTNCFSQRSKKNKSRSEIDDESRQVYRTINKRLREISTGGSDASFEGKTTRRSTLGAPSSSISSNGRDTNLTMNETKKLQIVDFNSYCLSTLEKLCKHPNAGWFLQPVDPEIDGVPDYFSVVQNPMDFQTIREKLSQGMYKNPFGWQLDMRLVFYNALLYHKDPNNSVRRDAIQLASEFEQRCRELPEINPYYYSIQLRNKYKVEIESIKSKIESLNMDNLKFLISIIKDDTEKDIELSVTAIIKEFEYLPYIKQKQLESVICILHKQQENSSKIYCMDTCMGILNTNLGNQEISMTPSSGSEVPDTPKHSQSGISENSGDFRSFKTEKNELTPEVHLSGNIVIKDIHETEDVLITSIPNQAIPIQPQESAWGEWKAKVIQNSTIAQRDNAPKKSKREREAEQANAEI